MQGIRVGATAPQAGGRIPAVELFLAILCVLVVSLGSFQLRFNLPATGFVLFLVIVVAALRLGFWQATLTSVAAVACLDFLFTEPLYSFKTDATGLTALAAFECAALVVSRLSAQVQLQANLARQQGTNMERLYELARNILLVDRHQPTGPQIAGYIRQAIGVDSVALFDADAKEVYTAGARYPELGDTARDAWLTKRDDDDAERHTWSRVLSPGDKATGAIALRAEHLSPIVADAIASIASIALERSRSLEKETQAEAARQSEQLRAAVLDALAHAFKTPLTTILAASSGLLEAGTLAPQEAELATLIDEQSVILNDLATRLLQTARLEGTEIRLRRGERSLGELIEDVTEPFAAHFAHRQLRLEVPDGEIPVPGDCELIVTAVRQLVDNAIKYSDPATPITISAGESEEGGELLIRVHNEGPAIRPEDRERIFERFYRSPNAGRRAAGTGLGLSITKKIAEAHHGRVWAESPGTGATFVMALPVDADASHRGLSRRDVNDVPGE